MVTITYKYKDDPVERTFYGTPKEAKDYRAWLTGIGGTVVSVAGQDEADEESDIDELRKLLPKLRKLAATVVLPAFMFLKLHLVRPDLIPYPTFFERWC